MRVRSAATGMVALALAVAGCTALSGLDSLRTEDDDPLLGPDARAAQSDASTDRGVLPDGATAMDASADTMTDSPAGDGAVLGDSAVGSGFCGTLPAVPTLCTDFDDNVFPGPWQIVNPTRVDVGKGYVRSPELGLRLRPSSGGGGALTRTFPSAPTTSLKMGFSMRVENNGAGDHEIAVIRLGTRAGNPYEAQFEISSSGDLHLEEETPLISGQVTQQTINFGRNMATGAWKRFEVTITFAASSSTLRVDLEGSPTPFTIGIAADQYLAAPTIVIGDDSGGSTRTIYYDDVVVDVK